MANPVEGTTHDDAMADFLGTPAPAKVVDKGEENEGGKGDGQDGGQNPADTDPPKGDEQNGGTKGASDDNNNADGNDYKFDEAGYLAKVSNGTLNSADDLQAILDKSNSATELEAKVAELTAKLEEQSNVKPYANEYIEKLNNLYKEGSDKSKIDAFIRINSLGDISDLSPSEALIYDLQDQYKLSREDAEEHINSKYKLDEDKYDEQEIRAAKIQMKIDSETAKKRLSEYKASFDVVSEGKADVNQKTDAELAKEREDFVRKQTPVVNDIELKLDGAFKGFNTNGKQGDEARLVDLAVPAEVRKSVAQQTLELASNYGIDGTTPEGKEQLQEFAENSVVLAMYKSWIIDASNKTDEAVRAEFHNPDTIKRGDANPNKTVLSDEQKGVQAILDDY